MPKKVALGRGHARSPSARSGARQGGARPRVIVDVAAPAGRCRPVRRGARRRDWALPVPARIEGAPAGLQRFTFELDGAPPGAKYEGAADHPDGGCRGQLPIEVAIRLD